MTSGQVERILDTTTDTGVHIGHESPMVVGVANESGYVRIGRSTSVCLFFWSREDVARLRTALVALEDQMGAAAEGMVAR